MPKSKSEQMLTCIVTLTPTQALALRDLGIDLEFRCPNPDCNQLVKPVGKGNSQPVPKLDRAVDKLFAVRTRPTCVSAVSQGTTN